MKWRRSDTVVVVLLWTLVFVSDRVVSAFVGDDASETAEGVYPGATPGAIAFALAVIAAGVLTCIRMAARRVRQRRINIVAVAVIWLVVIAVAPASDGSWEDEYGSAFWSLIAGTALTVLYFVAHNVVISKWMARSHETTASLRDGDPDSRPPEPKPSFRP
jgi:peptidoglycan/LPS O-acetylase OafA/YrhL